MNVEKNILISVNKSIFTCLLFVVHLRCQSYLAIFYMYVCLCVTNILTQLLRDPIFGDYK